MLSRRNGRCWGIGRDAIPTKWTLLGDRSGYYPDEMDVAGGLPNIIRTERTLLGDRSGCYPDEINVAKI